MKTALLERRRDRRGANERGESPYGARARKAIMMDNPRLVPHVRSRTMRGQEEWRKNERGERAERKKGGREKRCGTARGRAGWDTVRACSAVFHHSSLRFAPFL